jgi:4-amino-4-deoxy-L-arabinose transferase-like glycosyltransferase
MKRNNITYKKAVLILIGAGFILRCFLSLLLELGNDEAYYWLYSQKLEWNYFDHPPLVALWVRIFTANLLLQEYEFFLRLGSMVGCALSTWFLYKTMSLIHSERAGWFAACLYNASFYVGLTSGLYLMPDAPQMVFWTFSMWMVAKISVDDKNRIYWLLFGIGAGLCIMSKVHGIFLWCGMGLFVLFKKREWLLNPWLYISFLITVLIISPIFFWNLDHDFITYRFHSQRVTIDSNFIDQFSFPREVGHQIIFNNPINVLLICTALIAFYKTTIKPTGALRVYMFIGLPLALLLLFLSIFRDTILIHWSGPAYVSLLPLAAFYLVNNTADFFPRILRFSIVSFFTITILWTLAVRLFPGTWGHKEQESLGYSDITLDVYGWKEAGQKFNVIYENDKEKDITAEGTPVVCSYWWGAHVEYYFCFPLGIQMIGLGPVQSIHQYHWFNKYRKDKVKMKQAYCIMPSDENYNLPTEYYNAIELIDSIEITRWGKPAHTFRVYRLSGWKGEMLVAE